MVAQKLGEMASIGALALAFALSGCASSAPGVAVAALTFVEAPYHEGNTGELQAPESRIVRTR